MAVDAPLPSGPVSYTVLDGTPRKLDRRARTDFMAAPMIFLTILAAVVVPVSFLAAPAGGIFAMVLFAGLYSLVAFLAHLRWSRFEWQSEPEALRLSRGVIIRSTSFVPYHRIQQIDLIQHPIQRLLGLSTLTLRTAAATTDAELPGVATADVEVLRQELLHRAGLDDAV